MKRYEPKVIEPKWQKTWAEQKLYEVSADPSKPKIYATPMLPYPSGAGLHTGHVRNYSITDAVARYYRQKGFNTLTAIAWDAFGLPAENYAIKTGTPPAESTAKNIAYFKSQLERIGMSYDWSREFDTSDPEYYRWTQWMFSLLYKRGLAYKAEKLQWWCDKCNTVLADEQVNASGKCWRHEGPDDAEVTKKSVNQWFFKITEYADEILQSTDSLDWPEKIKTMQKNWIGKSEGAIVKFALNSQPNTPNSELRTIDVYTTRPDTIYGATFIVIAPEHPMMDLLLDTCDNPKEVAEYVEKARRKSELERESEKVKTGVALQGITAKNPANGHDVPVWVADYVLTSYGTGAVMGVPAHDQRDNDFAHKYDLEIFDVIKADKDLSADELPYEGTLINSGEFDGMPTSEAKHAVIEHLAKQGLGEAKTQYRIRDWLISRQRYWGAPVPIVYCEEHGEVLVPEDQLPVRLPAVDNYVPDGKNSSVLAGVDEWVSTTCPECGKPAKRETDTMDGYVCSTWYLHRYTDANNSEKAFDTSKSNYWFPIDFYFGGDHAVAHLLYIRFFQKVLCDAGLAVEREPIKRLVYNGYINAEDGRKMSKSLGNTVDPMDTIDAGYGADALRVFELFIAPYDQDTSWNSNGVPGTYRFLNRLWTLAQEYLESQRASEPASQRDESPALLKVAHGVIKKVSDDMESLSFNTAVAAMMSAVNELYLIKAKSGYQAPEWRFALESLTQILAPFAPHISEELWHQLGHEDSVHVNHWPEYDEKYLVSDTITYAVQVNGKVRAEIVVPADADQDSVVAAARANEKVAGYITSDPKKVIFVSGKLISFVI